MAPNEAGKSDLLYAQGVISRDADGNVSLNQATDQGPIGTAFRTLMGAVVGVLAGARRIRRTLPTPCFFDKSSN